MKKIGIFIGLVMCLCLVNGVLGEVRINEVMYDPNETIGGALNEWIELFNDGDDAVNLSGWRISENGGNDSIDFSDSNTTFIESGGYFIIARKPINFSQYFDVSYPVAQNSFILNNDEDNISILDNNGSIIDSIHYNESNDWLESDNGNSLQKINFTKENTFDNWCINLSTPGSPNNCTPIVYGPEQNEDEDPPDSGNESELYLELEWEDDEIINGEEFEIEVHVYNLEGGDYNLRVWIEFEGDIISDRYDEENSEWKSGFFFINEFFEGPGNKSDSVKLKIRDDYEDFFWDAKIKAKLEDESESEIERSIEILEQNSTNEENNVVEEEIIKLETIELEQNTSITGEVIRLGGSINPVNSTNESLLETEDIKTQDNILYESKLESIKRYSVSGFALLCVILSILLIFRKLD